MLDACEDGTLLVRDSSTGGQVVSVIWRANPLPVGAYTHVKIVQPTPNTVGLADVDSFTTLQQLVQYYLRTPLLFAIRFWSGAEQKAPKLRALEASEYERPSRLPRVSEARHSAGGISLEEFTTMVNQRAPRGCSSGDGSAASSPMSPRPPAPLPPPPEPAAPLSVAATIVSAAEEQVERVSVAVGPSPKGPSPAGSRPPSPPPVADAAAMLGSRPSTPASIVTDGPAVSPRPETPPTPRKESAVYFGLEGAVEVRKGSPVQREGTSGLEEVGAAAGVEAPAKGRLVAEREQAPTPPPRRLPGKGDATQSSPLAVLPDYGACGDDA